MISNSDITFYNTYYDNASESTKAIKTHIRGVNWQGEQKVIISDKGLVSADVVTVFIPFTAECENKKYVKPKEFIKSEDKSNIFTYNTGDKIVRGIVDFEVDGTKGHTIKDLESTYDDVVNVISVITEDNGSSFMHHWEVGCK